MEVQRDRIQRYRGCLALCFADDSALLRKVRLLLESHQQQRSADGESPKHEFEQLDEDQWHLTLVTKAELKTLSADAIAEAHSLSTSRVFPIGLGGGGAQAHGVYFVVCVWPKAQAFRLKCGLPPKHFHVSVSVQNNHEVDKTIAALVDASASMEQLSMDALEALTRQVLQEGNQQEAALQIATQLCSKYGFKTTRGWLRLGDAAMQTQKFKLAMLSYAHVLNARGASEEGEDSALWRNCLSRMQMCAHSTEWGHLFVDSELDEIPFELHHYLLQRRWSNAVWRAVRDCADASRLVYSSRERLWTIAAATSSPPSNSPFYRLPRFFRWIVPFHLAVMSTPRNADDIRHLAQSIGIRHIVTLTKEEPLAPKWFSGMPSAIANTFLPVENYEAPTLAQIDLFMKICTTSLDSAGGPVLVHCGGGKGRAGVMVACYLVAFGCTPPMEPSRWIQPAMSADHAIQMLRAIRPGSIETERQEAIVRSYSSLLWKRRSVLPEPVEEPLASKPSIAGEPIEGTDLLVLCGLPGSGKSTFRQLIIKRSLASSSSSSRGSSRAPRWIELSGDEHGRQGCEQSIGLKGIQRAILDRVNGRPEDRKRFLELASTWSTHATAVWFDFDADLCVYRALQRPNHPSLPPGRRVANAVRQHAQEFQAPELGEGFRSVVRVTSIDAAQELARMLSPPIGLLKFPRTAHVINLGAATDDDLIMAETPTATPTASHAELGRSSIVITEKMDGANLGISLASDGFSFVVQNRSHYVNPESHTQFRKLDAFLKAHQATLYAVLKQDPLFPERFILYGEWMAATHSIPYSRLSDHFYAFDLFDRETHRFWDRPSLETLLEAASAAGDSNSAGERQILMVPQLWSGPQLPVKDELIAMVQQSRSQFYDGVVEGIYIKWECMGQVRHRGKIVRSDFLSGNEHWSKGIIRFNTIQPSP